MSHLPHVAFFACCCGCIVLGSLTESGSTGYSNSYLRKVMAYKEIIPQVIESEPSALLHIQFGPTRVYPGMELTPTDTKDEPTYVKWRDADPSKYHTLLMIDPDTLSRENHKTPDEERQWQWQHWLLVNIPGSNLSQAETLSVYVSPGPAQDSGLHRYIFLAFEQPQQLQFEEPRLTHRSPTNRSTFSVSTFTTKYGLNPKPVAGNLFVAQWDEYVPILYKEMDAEAVKEESDRENVNGAGSQRKCANLLLIFTFCLMKKYPFT